MLEVEPELKNGLDKVEIHCIDTLDEDKKYEFQKKLDWKMLQHNKGIIVRDLLRVAFNFSTTYHEQENKNLDLQT